MTNQTELFIVEREDGEWIDSYGNGGYSVYTSRAEAQDALDSEADSSEESAEHYKIVRFSRDFEPTAYANLKEGFRLGFEKLSGT